MCMGHVTQPEVQVQILAMLWASVQVIFRVPFNCPGRGYAGVLTP